VVVVGEEPAEDAVHLVEEDVEEHAEHPAVVAVVVPEADSAQREERGSSLYVFSDAIWVGVAFFADTDQTRYRNPIGTKVSSSHAARRISLSPRISHLASLCTARSAFRLALPRLEMPMARTLRRQQPPNTVSGTRSEASLRLVF